MQSSSLRLDASGLRMVTLCCLATFGTVSAVHAAPTTASAAIQGSSPKNAAVWVHPSDGVDTTDLALALTYVNDPSQKFRTLQCAIDFLQVYLALEYDAVDNDQQQGIVYALPGTYGPTVNGPASGDTLPIRMRDRVHVQGVGARRCTIRGASTNLQDVQNGVVTWPTQSAASTNAGVEVLLTYQDATVDIRDPFFNQALPWFDGSQPH